MSITVQAQLLLPAKSYHTKNGVCDVYDYEKVDLTLFKFFMGYGVEVDRIYSGSSVHMRVYNEMLDSLVEYGEVGSHKTYIKELGHDNRYYYITLLNDKEGQFYDVLINRGDKSDPKMYIDFRPHYYDCDILGTEDFHQIRPNFTSNITYRLDRKVVEVVDQARLLEFKMDDGTSLIYQFCHTDWDGSSYYDYGMLDTGSEGLSGWMFHGDQMSDGSDAFTCNHEHTCKVIPSTSLPPSKKQNHQHKEICNH